jgi:hypothetical protein
MRSVAAKWRLAAAGLVTIAVACGSLLPAGSARAGVYTPIVNYHSSKCFDDAGASMNSFNQMILWPCNGQSNQMWELYQWCTTACGAGGSYKGEAMLRNEHSGLCLATDGPGQAGDAVDQVPCNSTYDFEVWQIFQSGAIGYYTYVNYHAGQCMVPDSYGTSGGTPVEVWGSIPGSYCSGQTNHAYWWSINGSNS